jgi:hypothetical protein
MGEPRFEDFEYSYRSGDEMRGGGALMDGSIEEGEREDKGGACTERRYLGNGFTQHEMRERDAPGTQDSAWYLEKHVGEAILAAPEP